MAYDESAELWSSYQERLEQFFQANDPGNEKKACLTHCGTGRWSYLQYLA